MEDFFVEKFFTSFSPFLLCKEPWERLTSASLPLVLAYMLNLAPGALYRSDSYGRVAVWKHRYVMDQLGVSKNMKREREAGLRRD